MQNCGPPGIEFETTALNRRNSEQSCHIKKHQNYIYCLNFMINLNLLVGQK